MVVFETMRAPSRLSMPMRAMASISAWGVGAGNVDCQIAGQRGHDPRHHRIVCNPVGRILVGPHVDAHDPAPALARGQSFCGQPCAAIVEAHAVDHGPVFRQPEQAWQRIARLRQRGDRSDFGKAEAKPQQRIGHLPVLVEASRHAQRVGKIQAGHPRGQRAIRCSPLSFGQDLQGSHGQPVGTFGIKGEDRGAQKAVQHRPCYGIGPRACRCGQPARHFLGNASEPVTNCDKNVGLMSGSYNYAVAKVV